MSAEAIVAIVGASTGVLGLVFLVGRKIPKRLKTTKFTKKWRDLQRLCSDKETWAEAIIIADNLLDDAMKKRKKSGGSMGERLVESQHSFTKNEEVWHAHKLAKAVSSEEKAQKLKESDVKNALIAFRQALRDLGALR